MWNDSSHLSHEADIWDGWFHICRDVFCIIIWENNRQWRKIDVPLQKIKKKKKKPWKVVGWTFCLSLLKDKDYQIFFSHCQVRQLATVWGVILVRGPTLDACYRSAVRCCASHCLTNLLLEPVRSREKPPEPILFFKMRKPKQAHQISLSVKPAGNNEMLDIVSFLFCGFPPSLLLLSSALVLSPSC